MNNHNNLVNSNYHVDVLISGHRRGFHDGETGACGELEIGCPTVKADLGRRGPASGGMQ